MSERQDEKPEKSAGTASQAPRGPTPTEYRLARAAEKLRENLGRRKAQTRARRKGEAETGIGLPAARVAGETSGEEGVDD
nr:hypothetical protein [uncultured Gellertiella sp.]